MTVLTGDSYAVVGSLPARWLHDLAVRERSRLSVMGRRLAPLLEHVIEDLGRAATAGQRSDDRSVPHTDTFRARIVDGVTTRQAADLLGATPRAVVARLHRGTLRGQQGDDGCWVVDPAGLEQKDPNTR